MKPFLAALALVTGCAMALPAIVPSVVLVECLANLELHEPAGTSVMRLIADAFANCGKDVEAIFAVLADAHKGDPSFMAELAKAKAEYAKNPGAFKAKLGAMRR